MLSIMPHNTISRPSTMHIERISSGTAMDFGMHLVKTHMRKMYLTVVYTNDPVMVGDSINTMEQLLA